VKAHRTDGVIPGDKIFKLHDTFGFPVELTKELAEEQGLSLDLAGFEQAMQEQKERSKKEFIWTELSVKSQAALGELLKTAQTFVGYDKDEVTTNILDYKELEPNLYEVLLQETPFYAEAGGQVGDTGKIIGPDFELQVIDSYYKPVAKIRLVKAKLQKGAISKTAVTAIIDKPRRREIERAHTATHLLHSALRRIIGDYCKQEGSLVEPGRLRFDFVAFQPLTQEQINKIEQMVYSKVIENIKVEHLRDLPIEEAKKLGALAFFGEEYGEKVNVIKVGDFSCELCGGTHIRATGEIGMFRILSETGVAAGIRRIDALVGYEALRETISEHATLLELQKTFGVEYKILTQKVNELFSNQNMMSIRLRQVLSRLCNLLSDELIEKAEIIQDIKVIYANYDFFDVSDLRQIADLIRNKLKEKVVGLLFTSPPQADFVERVRYIVFVSKDLEAVLSAGKIAQQVGKALEGGGGGKPNLAEGGGKRGNIEKGILAFKEFIQNTLPNKSD